MWNLNFEISPGVSRVIDLKVKEDSERPDTKLSEHVVLDGTGSIIHNFGYGAGVRSISAVMLDNGDEYPLLVSGYHNGITYQLVSDQGPEGYYNIWTINKKRLQDISRTTPVLQVDLELKAV